MFWSPALHQPGIITHAYNHSAGEAEGPDVQGLHALEVSQGSVRQCLEEKFVSMMVAVDWQSQDLESPRRQASRQPLRV